MSRRELSAARAAPVFAALGDATRLSLVSRLCDGRAYSITELASGTKLTRQGVTKHLTTLRRAKIVMSRRSGRENLYQLRAESLELARDYLARASRQWDEAIDRLRSFVED
ncbi:ArsR/SmtB family transcription factor [Hyphococcus sp.]|uniref:ArsR/SmtB family transcription factor n=1 Tax=Hyphococcus sp. TaxID=2038636 RepID=UPI003D0E0F85